MRGMAVIALVLSMSALVPADGANAEPGSATAQTAGAMQRFGDGRDWFFEKRFGLFVHWGIYAIPAWHEQHQYRAGVPRREYEKLAEQFNPVGFDPDAWLDLAESVGMRYMCFTTKHHDGFCMWDTAQTSYNVMNTPYGKDILEQLADACHRRNFPLCLYYSIADMHHPNYPNQGRPYELEKPDPGDEPDVARYIEFVKAQIRELCTNYGEIHGIWFDGNEMKHKDPPIHEMIRNLQPKAVINDRGFADGDFSTPEREWNSEVNTAMAFAKPTEACQSIGMESWGYRHHEDFYSLEHLIRGIDKVMAKGGNYLLNVGPKADGTIPPEARQMLAAIGAWYNAVAESYQGVETVTHWLDSRDVLLTRNGNTLYVHLNQAPLGRRVILKPLRAVPRKATLLNDGREVQVRKEALTGNFREGKELVRLYDLPVDQFAGQVMVIKLEYDQLSEPVDKKTE